MYVLVLHVGFRDAHGLAADTGQCSALANSATNMLACGFQDVACSAVQINSNTNYQAANVLLENLVAFI